MTALPYNGLPSVMKAFFISP